MSFLKNILAFNMRPIRSAVACMMLFACLCQILIPSGFMPSFSANGKVALVICSGMGEKTVYVDGDTSPTAPEHTVDACPYVTLSFASDVPAPVILNAPIIFSAVNFIPHADKIFFSDPFSLSAPRAPPSIA